MQARCTSKGLFTLLNDIATSGKDEPLDATPVEATRSPPPVDGVRTGIGREITYRVLVGPGGHGVRPLWISSIRLGPHTVIVKGKQY
jgi:hypothetical protein